MGLRDLFPSFAQHAVSIASMRAPLRSEVYPIDFTTSSKRMNVPAAWKGHFVRVQAEDFDCYVQVANDANATANAAARCTEANTPIDLTPPNDGVYRVPEGTSLDIPFPSTAQTWAIVGKGAGVARCHLAET